MFVSDLNSMASAAVSKYDVCKNDPKKYFMRAIVAGFWIDVAMILSNVCAAVFYSTNPAVGKLLAAFTFPLAIILIVFIGGELFTGNNMTMAVGVYQKKCTWAQAIRVWVMSYVGNFVGAFLIAFLFVMSTASLGIITEYVNSFIMGKLELSPLELVLRGTLCNFMVCLAVLVGTRMKTESGKLIVMIMSIAAFVITGFEHSIANMGVFSMAAFVVEGGLPVALVAKSMVFVTIGNIIGGAFLMAWPLKVMAIDDTAN